MSDEARRVRRAEAVVQLLAHYAEAGLADRGAWQDRVMVLEGVPPRDLVRLHGELIARGWVEQNTGFTQVLRPGAVPQCYRVTAAGLRVFKEAQAGAPQEPVAAPQTP